jgi:hypothetical protein
MRLSLEMVFTAYTSFNLIDLAGARGQLKQRGAVERVLVLNWRGIVHTSGLLIFTNYVYLIYALTNSKSGIAWLILLHGFLDNRNARVAATAKWYQCVLHLGANTPQCESLARGIININVIWSAEIVLALVGLKTFVLETSRK